MRFPTGQQDHGAWAPRAFIAPIQSYLRSYRHAYLSVYSFKEVDEHRRDIKDYSVTIRRFTRVYIMIQRDYAV